MKIHFSKAFTFVEVLLAATTLLVVALGVVAGIVHLFRIERLSSQSVVNQQIVALVTEGVKADPSIYQKNLSGVDIATEDPAKLPLGYMDGLDLVDRKSCPVEGCQIYVGYIIQPSGNLSGLFQGTVRLHTPANSGVAASDQVYRFIITAQ